MFFYTLPPDESTETSAVTFVVFFCFVSSLLRNINRTTFQGGALRGIRAFPAIETRAHTESKSLGRTGHSRWGDRRQTDGRVRRRTELDWAGVREARAALKGREGERRGRAGTKEQRLEWGHVALCARPAAFSPH